ncbi:MAG: efflux RND transporter permease subunit [Saprospiraceae bacterium]
MGRLSVQLEATDQKPGFSVRFQWSNASPATIENEIITPLEAAFNLAPGIQRTYAIARNGSGTIDIEPMDGVDLDFLRFELNSKIRQLYPILPEGVSFPLLTLNNPEADEQERPILTYSLSGQDQPSQIYEYARETLTPQLAMRAGVESIDITGANAEEWRITYDAHKMDQLGLVSADILQALQETYGRANLGRATLGTTQIKLQLFNESTEQLRGTLLHIPIKKVENQIVFLQDIARVELTEQPIRRYYRINGQNSLRLLFYAEKGTNTIALAAAIREDIATLKTTLPASYELHLEDDATQYLSEELQKIVERTAWSLAILLVFVLLIYRSWRYLVVVLLSLIANLGIAFIFYELLEVELHLYALAGITVSFGIIIDNSIVMMHHLQKQGNRAVFPALLAATLTTISALIIIWFLPRKWQVNLLDFAKVLAINLSVSLLIAWALIPALMQQIRLFDGKAAMHRGSYKRLRWQAKWYRRYHNLLSTLLRRKKLVLAVVILSFGLPVFMLPNRWEGQEWYNKTLGDDYYVEYIKPYVSKMLGGTLRLFVWYVYEGASYRDASETVLVAQGRMPQGSTIEQMNTVYQQMEQYVGQFEQEVSRYTVQVSSGEYANMKIYFNPAYEESFPYILKSRLTSFGLNMGGIQWNIYGVGRSFSNASGGSPPSYRIKMQGYNKEGLEQQAERFAQKLLEHPRIQEVNTEANIEWFARDRYEYVLDLDRAAIASAGLLPLQISPLLQDFNQSNYPDWQLPNGQSVRLIHSDQKSNNLWVLNNKIHQVDSTKVDFSSLASLEKQKVASSIHKENQQYLRMVNYEYMGSGQFGSRYLKEVIDIIRKEMPLGYSLERQVGRFGGEDKKQYQLLLLVMILIFMICTIMFESIKQAFAIIFLIPVSFVGIFLTFYWFDFPFDQGGYTSFILLSGIVVNSLILIVNDFNRFRKQQANRASLDLFIKAFRQKITPIILTVISTVLGMIPFVLHGQNEVFWFSLAAGTMGGLLFSLLLITFLIPVFFVKRM